MCVQRLQAGKLEAKKAGTTLIDGSIKTACQQACPTNAIMFGDTNDEKSEVTTWRNSERNYVLLEEVGVKPTVSYMVKVRNQEEKILREENHSEPKHDDKKEAHSSEKHS
jgi:molybdopterin-containing oxidoreductase family iron-sulfur binding subunit